MAARTSLSPNPPAPVRSRHRQPDDPSHRRPVLDERTDGVADHLPAEFHDEECPGKEDTDLPDEDLGFAPVRAVLPLQITDRRKIRITVSPDRRFHAGTFVAK